MSIECINNNQCPTYEACNAALDALKIFSEKYEFPDEWRKPQEVIIDMRKMAIKAMASRVDCNQNRIANDNPDVCLNTETKPCPLPTGLVENCAFGSPDDMQRTAIKAVFGTNKLGF